VARRSRSTDVSLSCASALSIGETEFEKGRPLRRPFYLRYLHAPFSTSAISRHFTGAATPRRNNPLMD
jgi:hypothetical protein